MKKFFITSIVLFCMMATGLFLLYRQLDKPRREMVRAFGDIIEVYPTQGSSADGWFIAAPDNDAMFIWNNMGMSINVNIKEFADAGLDISKLDGNAENGRLIYTTAPYINPDPEPQPEPFAQFKNNMKHIKSYTGYHIETDSYKVEIQEGSTFNWAHNIEKDTNTGEKQYRDISFILSPEPLIAAGVDPEKVDSWEYIPITYFDGVETLEVYKFVKSFDIENSGLYKNTKE
ncbi:MAG: hypothetical protein FWG69_04005 [Oscillospiraceae bacterium]|nr:hypothetical protein [Oscillospiraceae bacterium]